MSRNKLFTVPELSQTLGISVHTVYAWVSQGRLPCVKLGTRTMFEPGEIERWVRERARHERVVTNAPILRRRIDETP